MGLFKRLLKGNISLKKTPKEKGETSECGKYYPGDILEIDQRFTNNFRKNGGKFLYCTDAKEINEAFDNILIENDWYEKEVFCINEMLSKKFNGYNLNFTKKDKRYLFLNYLRVFDIKKRFYFTFFKSN